MLVKQDGRMTFCLSLYKLPLTKKLLCIKTYYFGVKIKEYNLSKQKDPCDTYKYKPILQAESVLLRLSLKQFNYKLQSLISAWKKFNFCLLFLWQNEQSNSFTFKFSKGDRSRQYYKLSVCLA